MKFKTGLQKQNPDLRAKVFDKSPEWRLGGVKDKYKCHRVPFRVPGERSPRRQRLTPVHLAIHQFCADMLGVTMSAYLGRIYQHGKYESRIYWDLALDGQVSLEDALGYAAAEADRRYPLHGRPVQTVH